MVEYLELGEPVRGEEIYIPKEILSESVPGAYYRIKIKTKPITRVGFDAVAKTLWTELPRKIEGLKVRYVKVEWNRITIDVEGSPFPWSLVLIALPEILQAIGVILLVVGIYLVWTHVPGYVIGILAVGGMLLYFAPKIAEYVRAPFVKVIE